MSLPPAYSASAPAVTAVPLAHSTHRSITDTRALILGNAYILRPRRSRGDAEDISLIVARHTQPVPSAEETPLRQHYAFLVTRKNNSQGIEIVVKGMPRDTIEEALEWMLERTEDLVQEMLARHGRQIDSLGCCLECSRAVKNAGPGRANGVIQD